MDPTKLLTHGSASAFVCAIIIRSGCLAVHRLLTGAFVGRTHRFMQRAVFPSSGRVFAFQDGGFCRYPSTGRRRQTGRPNARPRTGCITRRTYFLRIIFKVLRLVYYCASVGADFYSFSYRTSCDLVARDQNLSPLAQPGFWR